jgi:hypothetical protein
MECFSFIPSLFFYSMCPIVPSVSPWFFVAQPSPLGAGGVTRCYCPKTNGSNNQQNSVINATAIRFMIKPTLVI